MCFSCDLLKRFVSHLCVNYLTYLAAVHEKQVLMKCFEWRKKSPSFSNQTAKYPEDNWKNYSIFPIKNNYLRFIFLPYLGHLDVFNYWILLMIKIITHLASSLLMLSVVLKRKVFNCVVCTVLTFQLDDLPENSPINIVQTPIPITTSVPKRAKSQKKKALAAALATAQEYSEISMEQKKLQVCGFLPFSPACSW